MTHFSPLMSPETQWFYTNAEKQQQGPVSLAEIRQMAASGQIQSTSLVWHEQMSNWTPAGEVPGLIALYRAWKVLQPGGARTTPGKAVGFLFIPLFNLYWVFVALYGWAQDWNRIRATQSGFASIPPASEGFFLTTVILLVSSIITSFIPLLNLLVFLALPILFIIMFSQIYRVVNGLAEAARTPQS